MLRRSRAALSWFRSPPAQPQTSAGEEAYEDIPVKPVHELRTYDVHPQYVGRYLKRLTEYLHVRQEYFTVLGYWKVELGGPTNRILQVWEYPSYKHRAELKEKMESDPRQKAFTKETRPMLLSKNSQILTPFEYWNVEATQTPKRAPGVGFYELRRYQVQAGKVWTWKNLWQDGLAVRSKYVDPVAAWYSEVGHLNTVYHMWYYEDLDERMFMRDQAWREDRWQHTFDSTTELIVNMDNMILKSVDGVDTKLC